MEIKKILKTLCECTGVTGAEREVAETIAEMLKDYTTDVEIDCFNNVVAKIDNGATQTILLDAHIDQVGMIVTGIDKKGFIKVAPCGGLDRRIVSAQTVTAHTAKGKLKGIVGSKPPHLETGGDANKVPPLDKIFIDFGMTSKEQAEEQIALGDRITVDGDFMEMKNNRIVAPALDDRAGVAAILVAIDQLKNQHVNANIVATFTVQEEVTALGAKVTSYRSDADYAIAVDVSFAMTPDAPALKCGDMGKGVMLSVSALLDKRMSDDLIALAKKEEIPHQIEVLTGRSTGTNIDSIMMSKSGIPSSILSIPLKYMHTPIEMVQIEDVQATADIMCAYIKSM